jgi:hypothetical protein
MPKIFFCQISSFSIHKVAQFVQKSLYGIHGRLDVFFLFLLLPSPGGLGSFERPKDPQEKPPGLR